MCGDVDEKGMLENGESFHPTMTKSLSKEIFFRKLRVSVIQGQRIPAALPFRCGVLTSELPIDSVIVYLKSFARTSSRYPVMSL